MSGRIVRRQHALEKEGNESTRRSIDNIGVREMVEAWLCTWHMPCKRGGAAGQVRDSVCNVCDRGVELGLWRPCAPERMVDRARKMETKRGLRAIHERNENMSHSDVARAKVSQGI